MYRHTILLTALLLLSISVSKASLYNNAFPDESLSPVAERLSRKEYAAARDAALQARPTAVRDFVIGVAAYRLERWEEAERALAGAADGFPLLGDFALHYRASALSRLSRFGEALPLLDRLRKEYPESPLLRSTMLLSADTLFQMGNFRGALAYYRGYTRAYPSGNDTLKALHRSAVCREKLGDAIGAARDLREIWLAQPGKKAAADAEADLARLRKAGVAVPAYAGEELLNRGLLLLERRNYGDAAAALSAIPAESLPEHLRGKRAFNHALALYRAKRNREAEEAFARLSSPERPYGEYSVASSYWHACALDRNGRDEEAAALFLNLAQERPASDLADDALFQAALIRKHAGKHGEAMALFRKITTGYPSSSHAPRALWEISWSLYFSGKHQGAAECFGLLSEDPAFREKALYWKARALEASGSMESARETRAVLMKEFPAGFYSLNLEKDAGVNGAPIPFINAEKELTPPLPDGHDRAKALISLGLYEEARMEISATRRAARKGSLDPMDLAGLYLAMDGYNSAMALFREDSLLRGDGEARQIWGILYPAAFREIVTRHSSNAGIDRSLAFALIRAESNFLPTARSPVGAMGLMQLMPATARGMNGSVTAAGLTRPDLNVRLGMQHLKDLLARFNGNLVSAVAAYNAGATPVTRWRKNFANLREDEFIENIPYPETREYVKKVLAAREIYRRLYGLKDPSPITNHVSTGRGIIASDVQAVPPPPLSLPAD